MTRDELKAKFDKYTGMKSQLVEKRDYDADLIYRSPTGIVLFKINIHNKGFDRWIYSGTSEGLPYCKKLIAGFEEE